MCSQGVIQNPIEANGKNHGDFNGDQYLGEVEVEENNKQLKKNP